jgi:hypothetical protein
MTVIRELQDRAVWDHPTDSINVSVSLNTCTTFTGRVQRSQTEHTRALNATSTQNSLTFNGTATGKLALQRHEAITALNDARVTNYLRHIRHTTAPSVVFEKAFRTLAASKHEILQPIKVSARHAVTSEKNKSLITLADAVAERIRCVRLTCCLTFVLQRQLLAFRAPTSIDTTKLFQSFLFYRTLPEGSGYEMPSTLQYTDTSYFHVIISTAPTFTAIETAM